MRSLLSSVKKVLHSHSVLLYLIFLYQVIGSNRLLADNITPKLCETHEAILNRNIFDSSLGNIGSSSSSSSSSDHPSSAQTVNETVKRSISMI